MEITYINNNELKTIIKNNDLILIVTNDENQVFKMMYAQLLKIKSFYKEKFKYFIVNDVVASNILHENITIFPQLLILRKENIVGCIRGFRKVTVPCHLIDLNF